MFTESFVIMVGGYSAVVTIKYKVLKFMKSKRTSEADSLCISTLQVTSPASPVYVSLA
jgi:hypothetical protein